MSATTAPGVASPVVSPSSRSLSIARVRVFGAGSVRQDFGHSVATNAAGQVLVAARFDDGAASPDDTARLVKFTSEGVPARTVLLRNTQDNAILLVGWFGGTMTLGDQEVTSPRGRASMFLAKLVRR